MKTAGADQPIHREPAQPVEEADSPFLKELRQPSAGNGKCLLNQVRRVESCRDSAVNSSGQAVSEPTAVPLKQTPDRRSITRGGVREQLVVELIGLKNHRKSADLERRLGGPRCRENSQHPCGQRILFAGKSRQATGDQFLETADSLWLVDMPGGNAGTERHRPQTVRPATFADQVAGAVQESVRSLAPKRE